MDYLTIFTSKSGRLLRGTANRLWGAAPGAPRQVRFLDSLQEWGPGPASAPGAGSARGGSNEGAGRRNSAVKGGLCPVGGECSKEEGGCVPWGESAVKRRAVSCGGRVQ
uniref:Uncharacterized protein n=1 Tax=Gopherus agassizii TaxID=38772 RepID=A0A452HTW9_9SAUR